MENNNYEEILNETYNTNDDYSTKERRSVKKLMEEFSKFNKNILKRKDNKFLKRLEFYEYTDNG